MDAELKVEVIEVSENRVVTAYEDAAALGTVVHREGCSCGDPRCPQQIATLSGQPFDARNNGF